MTTNSADRLYDFDECYRDQLAPYLIEDNIVGKFKVDALGDPVKEYPVYDVPIKVGDNFILKLREDNGRVAPEYFSYKSEKKDGVFSNLQDWQPWLLETLYNKDKAKTEDLMLDIKRFGQRVPAIITADGRLVDGNRRRVALHRLSTQTSSRPDQYNRMKVCVLPKTAHKPTVKDIRKLESAYQAQRDGKSDWAKLDWAVTRYLNNVRDGIGYEEQIKDLPDFRDRDTTAKKFIEDKLKEWKKDFIDPLSIVHNYLEYHYDIKDGQYPYSKIIEGKSWQTFTDAVLVKNLLDHLTEQRKIDELEQRDLLNSLYCVIRCGSGNSALNREHGDGIPTKTHNIMRMLGKKAVKRTLSGDTMSGSEASPLLTPDGRAPFLLISKISNKINSEKEIDINDEAAWKSNHSEHTYNKLFDVFQTKRRKQLVSKPKELINNVTKDVDNINITEAAPDLSLEDVNFLIKQLDMIIRTCADRRAELDKLRMNKQKEKK